MDEVRIKIMMSVSYIPSSERYRIELFYFVVSWIATCSWLWWLDGFALFVVG